MKGRSGRSRLFKSIATLTVCAMMVSVSVILGWIGRTYFTFGGGNIRITFENMPIIFCGMTFGPLIGFAVGVLCDLVSCLVAPQPTILPLITLGAGAVGLLSGLVSLFFKKENRRKLFSTIVSSFSGHLVGSVIIKSIALYYYYGQPLWFAMATRALTYAFICGAEIFILYVVFKNREIKKLISEIEKRNKQ